MHHGAVQEDGSTREVFHQQIAGVQSAATLRKDGLVRADDEAGVLQQCGKPVPQHVVTSVQVGVVAREGVVAEGVLMRQAELAERNWVRREVRER